jgi:Spy/CpxP family protein refolding chaperone
MTRRSILWMLLIASPVCSQILPDGLGNRWWRSPPMVEKLGLSPEQQKKMDDVFQQSRLKLIDLTASLDKEEAILEPLVSAERPDPDRIRAQISRVADARAELEKANANMLLGIRLLLTPEQWRGLQASAVKPRPRKMTNGGGSSPGPKKFR